MVPFHVKVKRQIPCFDYNVELFIKRGQTLSVLMRRHVKLIFCRCAVFMRCGSRIPLVSKLHGGCSHLFFFFLLLFFNLLQSTSLRFGSNPVCAEANP